MRVCQPAALLFVAAALLVQASTAEDIYWEGEEDASNEFIQFKEADNSLGGNLRRLKRQSWWSFFSNTESPTETEAVTEDDEEEEIDKEYEPDLGGEGSGSPIRSEPETKEKTLRVTFVVMEPYRQQYSSRDSEQFQNISRGLADAVNALFNSLPGTQRASLVRIQTRLSDEFSCKVTMEIVTSGYDNTKEIARILEEHIRLVRQLGQYTVSEKEFNSTDITDPGIATLDCAIDELRCDDGRCIPGSARCNSIVDCADGMDEMNCPVPEGDANTNQQTYRRGDDDEPEPPNGGEVTEYVPDDELPEGESRPNERDNEVVPQTSTAAPLFCSSTEFLCDNTRCLPLEKRCDQIQDCDDGSDEAVEICADKSCGVDDFRCNNGRCISGSRRCDHVIDCPSNEDEENCDCASNEFRCESDGVCIELRKRCDGTPHCMDSSDEVDCACGPDHWQCDYGSCIKRSKRCDGRVDCPTDRSDERNCFASGYFRCRNGKIISENQRCNRRYDCDPGDYSDEHNCPCGDNDFKCDNGYCIPASKHCDRTHDCQDGSDERNCTYGTVCMASQYKCSSGQCVQAESWCNGTKECDDGSDERNCPCKRDEFECRDGSCINIALRCNGRKDCRPYGEDEFNCGSRCSPDSFVCDAGSSIACARRCDGRQECDGGEDEANCNIECNHECDGRCLENRQICDGIVDCSDGSDEQLCEECDGPNDFRCTNGECINIAHRCNGLDDCADSSDEMHCNDTIPPKTICNDNEFQCPDGTCINNQFFCDGNNDCNDNSDEANCPWILLRPTTTPKPCHESEFTCYNGRCIPHIRRCDNIYDCSDFSDEQKCYHSACEEGYWQCQTGQCVLEEEYCDGKLDCTDGSDEVNCERTTWKPIGPFLTTRDPSLDYPTTRAPPSFYPTTTRIPPSSQAPTDYPPDSGYGDTTSQRGLDVYDKLGRPYDRPSRPPGYGKEACNWNQWRCENGPCIDSNQRCNGRVDCPYDRSDELDCPPHTRNLELKVFPSEQNIRYGGDVVFMCRDEGNLRAPVRWVREGGRPIKPGSSNVRGRLELYNVTMSDSGVYICQAPAYLGSDGAEVRATLVVEKEPITARPSFLLCKSYEATCGNGQCIPKTAVCDGRRDCRDGSDEDSCILPDKGLCEPNQFECANRKCVLKSWVCDSEDDCGDGSDEQGCIATDSNGECSAVEFACTQQHQCILKSYHCDGHYDCFDNSDEVGCAPIHVTKPPQPNNLRLNPGETLVLVCEAVGVPMPLISWRLNWGHVPAKCTSTSLNGVGTLTCNNMQPEDSGAYSCEAINRSGTTFAAPDSIVYVNKTDVCPTGYFNSEARSQSECIRCFCFGESNQCHSADLFTYNMPTPLGQGGTRLIGMQQSYTGEMQPSQQPISDLYYSQWLRNGATVTKLDRGSSWPSNSDAHPYLTLPETYNGNQLTSYGGRIKYNVAPHILRYEPSYIQLPDIVIKGKYQTLTYKYRGDTTRDIYIEARLTPGNWQKSGPRGEEPASREDIMMALDNIETILLRADMNNAGVNISDFAMESAQHINVGLGAASLVEECTCPPGYEGLSCEKCAADYIRIKTGPWLGNCVKKRECPPGTYGDPNSGYDCKPCPCPLTNRGNQFAKTCSVGSNGDVICDCFPGYEGPDCRYCAQDYVGNPLIPGDSCKLKPTDNCNPLGTSNVRLPDECVCKDNVQGRYCDECKNGSFYLSQDFRHGCALCFCSGVSQQCTSSTNLRRKTMTARFNVPNIVSQVKVYSSSPTSNGGAIRYKAPVETDLQPQLYAGSIGVTTVDRSRPAIYYWSLPASFAGDKVTAYGGYLSYTLNNVPYGAPSSRNNAADVQLISDVTFHYFGNFVSSSDGFLNASVQFLEKGWQRPDGKEVSREHFLLALAHVKTILIKASYTSNDRLASLDSASIETAEANGNGPLAMHVEQCVCPTGYVGTSCENCAPGYTRSLKGLYLKHCDVCECNGHSNMCHPETGECYDCRDNTAGVNCEACKDGYERDIFGNCVAETTTQRYCNCDPRGEEAPCDPSGYCHCKRNVEGNSCDRCRPGTFGLDASNPLGCLPCYCSGATTECHEATHFSRIPKAAPVFGENNGGYTLMDLNAAEVINDQFVSAPHMSELLYIFSRTPEKDLYWSLPEFSGNRVLSYGGVLALTQKYEAMGEPDESKPYIVLVGEDRSIYWEGPTPIRSGEALSYQVPLSESGWKILNSYTEANRQDFMSVLKNLKRVLVKATFSSNILSSAIADVSMDTATESYDTGAPVAKGVEICLCPEGYSGTSCETCVAGYYKDDNGFCRQCNCNGHDCQLGVYGDVVCNCRPPYTGRDCSTVGLIMELHPKIHDNGDLSTYIRKVTFTCKYRAPEPLTIKFYFEGEEVEPPRYYNESRLYEDGWRGEHTWQTRWDTRQQGQIYECRTITERGFTLGVLTTTLPEKGGDSSTGTEGTTPPPPQSTVAVKIVSPTIKIQEVGSTVNFTCQAWSRNTPYALSVNWTKVDGHLPQGRAHIDYRTGQLLITNLQISDSGQYICQTSDGISTGQAIATLKVPGNEMTMPTVTIKPTINNYYEGDRIELECLATGNPAPRITWQRASNRPLPRALYYDAHFVIESALEEDSGEYRCIASNAVGSTDRSAIVNVRPRPSRPPRERLTVSTSAANVTEGQSIRIVCTGTTNVPAGSIEWIRQDGTGLMTNVRSDNGILYIDYAVPDNQGVYICQSISIKIAPVPVLVTIIPITTPPPSEVSNITVSVNQVKIPTGGSGSVDCIPSGFPQPLIKWSKVSRVENGMAQVDFGPGVSQRDNTLLISNAQDDDEGFYLCEGIVDGTPVVNVYVFVDIEKREKPRVEIWPQGEQAVALGSRFEIICRVLGGVPKPDIMWSRSGGRPLSPHAKIQPENVLSLEAIDVNDEGEYICSATNVAGVDSGSTVLKVRSPPEVAITPSNYVLAINGDSVTIECRANGYPEPMVSIKSSSDFREIVPPSAGIAVLRIPSASERDDGDYTCTATSAAGTIDEQFRITVERGDGGFTNEGSGEENIGETYPYDVTPTTSIAIEGRDARLVCNGSNDFEVRWRRTDEMPLQSNAYDRGAELIIYNATKADTGVYECSFINRENGEVQHASAIKLLVLTAPTITLRPLSQIVQPGQSPTVDCVVNGDNILDITWRPVNRQPSSRVEIRGSTLIFHQIEVEDAGQYECFARNAFANASAVAEVIVSEETDHATTESHNNEQSAHVGAAVHLSCNVTQPNLRISWTKDGKALPRSARQKSDGSLFIRLAQKSDSGHYVCTIYDQYGRQTSNYINLYIEGNECSETQFRCHDDTGCIDEELLCDGFKDCQDSSDEENCLSMDDRGPPTFWDLYANNAGPRDQTPAPVAIEQPRRQFRVGENVQVICKSGSRANKVTWERYGTRQFVESRTYGDGAMLVIIGVEESDAGIYRCIGQDPYGRTYYDDFELVVIPGSNNPPYPIDTNDRQPQAFTARLRQPVSLPCNHNMEQPVSIEWSKEYSQLPADVRTNEPVLHIDNVTEADAGTYICRISNNRATIETRAILQVTGIVPRFNGDGWISLPTLKDAYMQFDIEISFKPTDPNGLIMFSGQNEDFTGDYLALQLRGGVPIFMLDTGSGPLVVSGDRPLQLNTWHTIRLSRTNSKVTMNVGNTGPFITESSVPWETLELNQPMYIGGVPDPRRLPDQLVNTSGFIGCVSMLNLGREEKNIIMDSYDSYNVMECDSCVPNLCMHNGVCQEARNERGYVCLCTAGYAGDNCDRTGQACRSGLCGPGKCIDTADGYKCACPVTYTGKNCDVKQSIEYPAFTGSAYLAIKLPLTTRFFRMSMKIKATAPVTDGIIMYCKARGGGFMALTVHNGRLEFRVDLGELGSKPVVLTSNKTLPANEWTDVLIGRVGSEVSMKINKIDSYKERLVSYKKDMGLTLDTPMFVGGVDESIILNNSTGVTSGFSGCIKDVSLQGDHVDIVNSSIQSANVQECSNYDRGDIPEIESICSLCRNGGSCASPDSTACTCRPGYTGLYCEMRAPSIAYRQPDRNPCKAKPCRNGGLCKIDRTTSMNYSCDCPLGYAGTNCQMSLVLLQSVGFAGNGYLELPANLLRYERLEDDPAIIALAIHAYSDGVLLYQRETQINDDSGDYILLRVENGIVVMEWDKGAGRSVLRIENVHVTDGERHQIIAKLLADNQAYLSVDGIFKTGSSTGFSNTMNADSNIYIGGIPPAYNFQNFPGLSGCIEQVELMNSDRGILLGTTAVAGRNAQRCRD